MKFTYAYKTSDGVRREGAVEAPSRDAAFAELRSHGIRPIKVVAADGSKANGAPRSFPRRTALLVVTLASTAAVAILFFVSSLVTNKHGSDTPAVTPRHQIYGDPAIVGEIEHGRLDAFLPQPGDRRLAWFAQPGRLTTPKDISENDLRQPSNEALGEIKTAAKSNLVISDSDPREIRELKQIVNGIHEELKAYLKNGNGTVRSYWRRLLERTRQEALIFERTKRELEKETRAVVWEQKNEALRRIGLRTIPNPRETD